MELAVFFGPALTQQASWYSGEQPARVTPVMTMHLTVALKKIMTSSKIYAWFNEPRVNELTVSADTQGKSLKECRRCAKAGLRDDVMAIRAGEINERAHVNDENVAGLVDVDGSDSDFWLCVVVERFTTVLEAAGKTVEGRYLQRKDEYLVVQWLELIEGGNGREYELSNVRDCI